MVATHAPDGEVWSWEFAHTTGMLPEPALPVRSFRYMKTPVVTGTLPDGNPVGFAADVQGRFWASDLKVTSPEQPTWKPLDIPNAGLAPVGELTTVDTPIGIRLSGVNSAGDVVSGLYAVAGSSLGFYGLGATGAIGTVGMARDRASVTCMTVRHGDNTLWSRTPNGWAEVSTTVNDTPVELAGSPTVIYDPLTQRSGALFRTDAFQPGALYVVWETAPETCDFSCTASGYSLTTDGIMPDVVAWDFRAEGSSRRWGFTYWDSKDGKREVG